MRTRLTRWLAGRLAARLVQIPETREADVFIGGRADVYLERWHVIRRNPFLNVYLHRFHRDDDDRALHDHPWASVSLMLSGELAEVYALGGREAIRRVTVGDLIYRGARFAHRLCVLDKGSMTLFVTGPRIRQWGFHCGADTPAGGWRHWKAFTGHATTGDGTVVGRGCE